ncbi:hypothetical protein [Thermoleptolyngbya sp. C42_A2020_037]|nr:hypothetical protein [Thermoleptolyngbya sp. C42_A2020_037]MBF2086167.1 hypothetical protein [Thermoleptolyngbya sp. C42_A2020_037]
MVFAQPGLVQLEVTLFFADVGRSPDLVLTPETDPEPHPSTLGPDSA